MSGGIRRKFPFGEDISFQPFATYAQLRDAVETLRGPQPRCNTAYWNDSFIGLVLPPEALDLVNKTTSMCPQQRGTATQLRTHPFFTGTDFSEVLQACAKDTGWDDVGRVAPLQPGRLIGEGHGTFSRTGDFAGIAVSGSLALVIDCVGRPMVMTLQGRS
eukprot:CAMPEP_0204361816 /NCGR_PEP_ID=MMETSP0469-20131031/39106_1 /ASSEMBLY_ACC=CAM_ASM_000384 /TAXON_ID=2969 /ORGANISM="Oxyrrhis marina" /LENGTH=159 /DNA_ID=CAMNT_0051350267 /DNA_START=20 /DNA_END=497 /DNA_ORIENTATION=-